MTRLTIKEVERRVDEIVAVARDPEDAHGKEDDLYRDVLQAIRDGHRSPARLADAALLTAGIDFPRWSA